LSLGTLVLSLADNKQLLGLRYAEWAIRAPSLEADIAAAAMGLDDIGHSRVLLGCLEPLGEDPRGSERESDAASYLNLPYFDEPWTAWGQFVAANAVLDTAFTVMIQAMVDGEVEVLQTRLRKMLMEERYHFLHGRSWLAELGPTPAVDRAWEEAVEWFGPDGAELRRRLAGKLDRPEPKLEVDWSRWDPIRRRTRPGAIDRHTFDMLRGLEEKRYGIVKESSPARG
jgi:ring-1,2-phenylacetyl-CoA epoxidase subunit PaaC